MLRQTDIRRARRHLRSSDPVMKAVIDAVGPFTLHLERDRFHMLVRFHYFPADFHQCRPFDPQAATRTRPGHESGDHCPVHRGPTAVGRFVRRRRQPTSPIWHTK